MPSFLEWLLSVLFWPLSAYFHSWTSRLSGFQQLSHMSQHLSPTSCKSPKFALLAVISRLTTLLSLGKKNCFSLTNLHLRPEFRQRGTLGLGQRAIPEHIATLINPTGRKETKETQHSPHIIILSSPIDCALQKS